ncbi:MAG: hypothetical protein K6C33_02535 [Desulfovibrio sp.]|nr:hypothetical protein [Desulfovibrio sp.]
MKQLASLLALACVLAFSCQTAQAMDRKTGQAILEKALTIHAVTEGDKSRLTDAFLEENFRYLACNLCEGEFDEKAGATRFSATEVQGTIVDLFGRPAAVPRYAKAKGKHLYIDNCGDAGEHPDVIKFVKAEDKDGRTVVVGDMFTSYGENPRKKDGTLRVTVRPEKSSPFGYVLEGIAD